MEEFVISEIGARFNQITGGSPETDLNKRIFALTGGEFNALDLFRRVFGFRGIPYGIKQAPYQQNEVDGRDFTGIKTYTTKGDYGIQSMGTPIFQPVRFSDLGDLKTGKKLDPYLLPNEPLVTISNNKRLVETPSAGGTQDIIEHISLNYYTIKIQGIVVNMENDDYPEEEIRAIRAYYELGRSFEVFCPILSLFNISLLACKTINIPAVEGYQAMQGYEITGRSDKKYQLVKRKNA